MDVPTQAQQVVPAVSTATVASLWAAKAQKGAPTMAETAEVAQRLVEALMEEPLARQVRKTEERPQRAGCPRPAGSTERAVGPGAREELEAKVEPCR